MARISQLYETGITAPSRSQGTEEKQHASVVLHIVKALVSASRQIIDLTLHRLLIACALVYAAGLFMSVEAAAPIMPSGLGTEVAPAAAQPAGSMQYDITGGSRVGANLFHSFGAFTVPQHTIANFLNDSGLTTSNILARVTGDAPSHIFGMIQTTGFGNANLFLMNPAGIVSGPTASLNIGGSVTFTTANYMRFHESNGQSGIFHANPAQPDLLTSAPVAAFGFLSTNPSPISVQGSTLTTRLGQSLSFIGGNIDIESGTLATHQHPLPSSTTAGGRITLASVASPGELAATTLHAAPNIHSQTHEAFGTITIANQSAIDTSGAGGGTVLIRSGQFVLDNSKMTAHATGPGLITQGVESIGDGITIHGSQDVTIQNGATIQVSVADGATPGTTFGGVHVTGDRIRFLGIPGSAADFNNLRFTKINTNTVGRGHAGPVMLHATGNIELTNVVELSSYSGIHPDGTGPSAILAHGNAGKVALTSLHGDILMRSGGRATQVASQVWNSTGDTGAVTASAPRGTIVLDGAGLITESFDGPGQIAPVSITAHDLHMKAGILSNVNRGPSKPGGITITLSDSMTLEADTTVPAEIPSQSFVVTSALAPTAKGPAGDITITVKDIVATQNTLISTETFTSGSGGQLEIVADRLQLTGGSQIKSGSTFATPHLIEPRGNIPTGSIGNILIRTLGPTGSIDIAGQGSGIFSNTEGTEAGGTINLSARTLTIQNGGVLSAETSGISPRAIGGTITVKASDRVTLTNGGSITASSIIDPKTPNSGIANAGNIWVDAGQRLELWDGSSIRTTTASRQANGGNITVQAIDRVRLVNQSEISTSVNGADGSGGNIFIDPKVVVLQDSNVTAQAIGGAGGNITFITPLFVADSGSLVSASSARGPSGTVTIQSPTANLSGTVGQLAAQTTPPQVLLQNRCVALASSPQSTFILAGRDSLPAEPSGWLSSPFTIGHVAEEGPEHASGVSAMSITPAHPPVPIPHVGNDIVLSLRRLTPPGFLVRTFAKPSTGCAS